MNIRDAIGQINFLANKEATVKTLRRAVAGITAEGRRSAAGLGSFIKGVGALGAELEAKVDSWLEPEDVVSGKAGRIDICDLRIWLEIAEKAEVDAVPAREILRMSEVELESVLEKLNIPEHLANNMQRHIDSAIATDEALSAAVEAAQNLPKPIGERAPQDLMDRAFDAMEGIPASWMVRTHLCGSSNLKSLVGTGVMLKGDDTARLAPEVEVGAGWAQIGNRRVIDFRDKRFVEKGAVGHKPVTHYLARPWAQPARFHEGEDLHRANSPLAGPGKWPAEWRVYVKNGEVSGVANYYSWTGEGRTAQNAWNAIEAAAAAAQMVEVAVEQGLTSGYSNDFMTLRAAKLQPRIAKAIEGWDPEGFHATMDFLETEDGLVFLEGGPGHKPGGGGHPTAFAGQGNDDPSGSPFSASDCVGVAYRCMPHVHLGEPKTWVDGDPEGCIDDWAAAAEIAVEHAELSDRAVAFLEGRGVELSPTCDMEL